MARRARQISLRECYEILHLEKGADLAAVKSAYRKRAFELHPDLNPGNMEASRQFQQLNEAYVALSAMLKPQEEARQKAQAGKSETKQEKKTEKQSATTTDKQADAEKAQKAYAEQDVLRDLLNDPFARRVFEDIYSELNRNKRPQAQQSTPPPPPPPPPPQQERKDTKQEPRTTQAKIAPLWERTPEKGVKGVVKDWLRRQIDEEQTLVFPASRLAPGRKIRLQIRRGMSEDLSAVEVTLPPDFQIGKPVRLKGLGKHVGPWRGDLYLIINAE